MPHLPVARRMPDYAVFGGRLRSALDFPELQPAPAAPLPDGAPDWSLTIASPDDAFVALFSESAARVLVTVPDGDAERLVELAAEHGVPIAALGVTGGDVLGVDGQFEIPVDELRAAWTATLPAALG